MLLPPPHHREPATRVKQVMASLLKPMALGLLKSQIPSNKGYQHTKVIWGLIFDLTLTLTHFFSKTHGAMTWLATIIRVKRKSRSCKVDHSCYWFVVHRGFALSIICSLDCSLLSTSTPEIVALVVSTSFDKRSQLLCVYNSLNAEWKL